MARKKKDRGRPPARMVSAKDTAANPLPDTFPPRRLWLLLGVVVALAIAAILTLSRPWEWGDGDGNGPRVELPPPSRTSEQSNAVGHGDFVGSETCASCHQQQFALWKNSTHGRAGGAPGQVAVLARFDGTPIRFKDAVVIPAARGNRYTFSVRQTGREERVFNVDGIVGGGHMEGGGTQGFVSRVPDGTYRFLPFDFIRREGVWFCNTGGRSIRGWVPITPQLALAECGDWPPSRVLGDELRFSNCQSCHGSQIQVSLDPAAPQYETTFSSLGINCESCHGPGRRHLALVKDARAVASGEIGMLPLATLTKDGSLGVCWQCHALKDRLQGGFLSGKPLDAYYSVHLPQLGERAHFADGRVRTFGYQEGHLWSDCYVNGGMTCTSCHDPHSQGYRDVNGTPLVGRDDDRQCTSCHQAKGAALEAHTRHTAASAGSRCVACHMPYLQEPEIGTALRYARSDHAIPVPRPAADAALGITSSCRGCHTDRTEQALNAQVADWYGTLKPRAPAITAALELPNETDRVKAAGRVLRVEEKHTAALFAGMALFSEQFLSADMPTLERGVIERLEQLSSHPDLDVRALALASLHLAAGERGSVRTFLAARLTALGADESRVRSRWTVVLGFFADRERERGDATVGATIYAKALEVEPDNARLHLNRGVALAQTGEYAPAVASIERSLVLNPAQPLALVNLGISRSALGDKMGAMAAYQKALSFNAREALAWFNLGNVHFELGRESEAGAAYAKAVESDPSLPLAHFYLARSLAKSGAIARALREVDAGLEFDPQNAEALSVRAQLQRMLVGPPASQ